MLRGGGVWRLLCAAACWALWHNKRTVAIVGIVGRDRLRSGGCHEHAGSGECGRLRHEVSAHLRVQLRRNAIGGCRFAGVLLCACRALRVLPWRVALYLRVLPWRVALYRQRGTLRVYACRPLFRCAASSHDRSIRLPVHPSARPCSPRFTIYLFLNAELDATPRTKLLFFGGAIEYQLETICSLNHNGGLTPPDDLGLATLACPWYSGGVRQTVYR
eukprot:357580-Chlamydomonas_euryale.AAC.1